MAKSSKPRKAYKPGKVIKGGNLPPPLAERLRQETKALMALTALRNGLYNAKMGMDLIMFLAAFKPIIVGNHDAGVLLLSAFKVINAIKDRETRTGKWGATGDELKILEDAVLAFIDLYHSLNRAELEEGKADAERRRAIGLARAALST